MKCTVEIEAGGHKVPISNFDKVLYPETGFTKGDVIRYYLDIGHVLLPHLKNRALAANDSSVSAAETAP